MRHLKSGRKLSRRKGHRTAMLANLAASIIRHGSVRTTDAKAKEVRPFLERMVTFARRGDLHARRIVLSRLKDPVAVKKLFDEIGPRFANRFGGYTRIVKLGFRHGDNSSMSLIEFVDESAGQKTAKPKAKKSARPSKKTETVKAETVETEETEAVEAEAAEEAPADAEAVEETAGEETAAASESTDEESVEEEKASEAAPEPEVKEEAPEAGASAAEEEEAPGSDNAEEPADEDKKE